MAVHFTSRFPETEQRFCFRILILNFVEICLYPRKWVHFINPVHTKLVKKFLAIICNKPTRYNSGSIVFIKNYKYALRVLTDLDIYTGFIPTTCMLYMCSPTLTSTQDLFQLQVCCTCAHRPWHLHRIYSNKTVSNHS